MHWRALSPRRRLLFALIAAAVAALVVVIVAALMPGPVTAIRTDKPGTVILVPGFGGDRNSLQPLADRIRADGRQAQILTLPGDGTGDLLQQVSVLDKAVDDAIAAGSPSVDIVGYSAGGVVTKLWIADDNGAKRARRVITLGSPLHGTQLAAAGNALAPGACPTACQQLAPGSPVLAPIGGAAGLPWMSIWTEDDQTVTPPDTARLTGAINVSLQQLCPGVRVAHEQLPTDARVIALVLAGLGQATLTAPSECPREGVS
ncbi:esterase/lipase family protein [Kutzneria sp. NPDC052558]|uniref:esterase/lipase family protein n=1 Tax=Kutzneria sp. NPDC052558 TaxID=3364121 RepID=UPI0037C56DFF